jgi:hypothetical protein
MAATRGKPDEKGEKGNLEFSLIWKRKINAGILGGASHAGSASDARRARARLTDMLNSIQRASAILRGFAHE